MNARYHIPLILLVIFFPSCESGDPMVTPEDVGKRTAERGDDPFTLKVGESIFFAAESLELGFQAVAQDSRCGTGAVCVWEGTAAVQLWLIKGTPDTVVVTSYLNGYIEPGTNERVHRIDTLGVSISLLQLDPYPRADSRTPQSEYVATLRVQ